MINSDYTATYSPEDNKLRLYTAERLDKETYDTVRAAGFRWAAKQELFVAPKWTPSREDLLLNLAGEIGDEDTSLVDRAEIRAERFDEYRGKRAQDANTAHDQVKEIADNIPLGQPILVGHHSEKRARKDAERIENGMRKAVKMWETSRYWEMRAAGALSHAKYKERPDVRARRIKKIEADIRRLESYYTPDPKIKEIMQTGWKDTEPSLHVWCGKGRGGHWVKKANLENIKNSYVRWIAHYKNRLTYEKAMLDAQGAGDLLKPKPRPKQLPLLNYRAPEGISIENNYHKGQFSIYTQVEMTKAQYSKVYTDYKGTRKIENSHRVRIVLLKVKGQIGMKHCVVFLTDSKTHKKPAPGAPKSTPMPKIEPKEYYTPPERTIFDDMKDTLKTGIKTVSAPQLFPTPPEVAEKMVEMAGINEGDRVLEPSAGTGNILKAIGPGPDKVAVEINQSLVDVLVRTGFSGLHIHQADFLQCNGDLGKFEKIIMNPPYKNGEDIKHIKHAASFLSPGGCLVALCADGPRQYTQLSPLADTWIPLPEGSFKGAGTNVNVVLLTISA